MYQMSAKCQIQRRIVIINGYLMQKTYPGNIPVLYTHFAKNMFMHPK